MKRVKRLVGSRVVLFHPGERGVLSELVAALVQIVSELLASEQAHEASALFGSTLTPAEVAARDPALRRLFPNAYDDEAQAAEFRRYTELDAALQRVESAALMWGDLDVDSDSVTIPDEHFGAWVTTLTSIRLVISERGDPDLDEVFEWTGWVLESLLAADI